MSTTIIFGTVAEFCQTPRFETGKYYTEKLPLYAQ